MKRARHTYEKVGFELFPVARYFKKLACADVKSQGLLCSLWAIVLVPSSHVWFHVTLIHQQGRDRLNPTYSDGLSHSFLLCEGSASSERLSLIGTVGCDIKSILDKTDVGGGILLSSRSNGYPVR